VAYAIDKSEIINGVLLAWARRQTAFPPQSWAFDPAVKDYDYNTDLARQLLSELGWKDEDGDGYLEKDGRKLAFTILTNQGNKLRQLSAEIIQSQLKKIGIKADIRVLEWSTFVHQFIDKKNFEAVILGWSLSATRTSTRYGTRNRPATGSITSFL